MPDVGNAYVQIVPSAKGITGSISKVLNGEAESAGKSAGLKISGGIGTALKATTAGLTAAAAGVAALAKQSVAYYAQYEQLVGGVQTLFGAGGLTMAEYATQEGKSVSQIADEYTNLKKVENEAITNAANAYKTAGLSANDYMSTVTSFSAALISSLDGDTEAAVAKADTAITDMSDNANKMGTSMESIQNAYQGFAKQNYTMLDNLKLGYGGTKTEMERLLKDAQELSGVEYDISSYADVVDAIHVIQDNMGITGTTAKEAQYTIEGSINSMKAAWTNLLTGMSDENQDFGQLVNNFVDSLLGTVDEKTGERTGGVINNIMPRVQQAIEGIGTLVSELGPVLIEQLPGLLNSLVPPLIEAAESMLASVFQMIPSLLSDLIIPLIPQLGTFAIELMDVLTDGLTEALPELIPAMVEAVVTLATGLVDNAPKIAMAGGKLIAALAEGLVAALPQLIAGAGQLLAGLLKILHQWPSMMLSIGLDIVKGIWKGINSGYDWITSKIKGWIGNVTDFIKNVLGIGSPSKVMAAEVGQWIPKGIGVGITANTDSVYDAIDDITAASTDAFNYGSVIKASSNGMTNAASGSNASGAVVSGMQAIRNDLNTLANKMNMGIFLDGTTLVGGIADRMDATLGRKQALALRGVK